MVCYFCGQPVRKDKRTRHHVLPQRYFGKGEDRDTDNIEIAHNSCHQRWHRLYDKPEMEAVQYCDYIQQLNWGRDIFASK